MAQIGLCVVGGAAVFMGIQALRKEEISLTKTAKLTGSNAKAAGIAVIVLGAALVAFGVFVLPAMFGLAD